MSSSVSLHASLCPQNAQGFVELKNLWLALRRQWRQIMFIAMATATGLLFAYFLFPFSYKATASVMLDPRSHNFAPGENVIVGFGTDPAIVESQAQYMMSSEFLWEVIVRHKLEQDPDLTHKIRLKADEEGWKDAVIAALNKKITVGRKGLTYIIEVTAKDKSSERAAFFANATAQTYVAVQKQTRQKITAEARNWINERLFIIKRKVQAAETALAAFKQEQGIIEAGSGNNLRERLLTDLTHQLSQAQADAAAAQARVKTLSKLQNLQLVMENDDFQSATLTDLRSQYASLVKQHAEVATVYGELHPLYTAAQLQIRSLSHQIENEIARLKSKQQNDYKHTQNKVALLEQRLADLKTDNTDFARLIELEETARADRKLYEQYLGRKKDLDQRENLTAHEVFILSRAFPPSRSAKPTLPLALSAIGFLSLMCGLIISLVREGRKDVYLQSSCQLNPDGLNVLAFLPVVQDYKPNAAYEHAIRRILPHLRGFQSIIITPENPYAQTDLLARSLASLMAISGQKVILFSLRKENECQETDRGLGDILYKGAAIEAMTRTLESGAYYLSLGFLPNNSHYERLLMDDRLRLIIERLQDKYDRVFIEAPEPLTLAGASHVLESADRVLLIPVWGESKLNAVRESARIINRNEEGFVTLVVDRTDHRKLALYDPDAAEILMPRYKKTFSPRLST